MYVSEKELKTDHAPRFRRSLLRLLRELQSARHVAAAIQAMEGAESSNLFIITAALALEADLKLRLIRILEDSNETSSFWYLHRCEPKAIAAEIDIGAFRHFSDRLKKVRDKVIVHIDKQAVFDPEAIYESVDIKWREIFAVLENLWRCLNKLYEKREGRKFDRIQVELSSLCQDFKRDFNRLKI
jgi:hypothetical protein